MSYRGIWRVKKERITPGCSISKQQRSSLSHRQCRRGSYPKEQNEQTAFEVVVHLGFDCEVCKQEDVYLLILRYENPYGIQLDSVIETGSHRLIVRPYVVHIYYTYALRHIYTYAYAGIRYVYWYILYRYVITLDGSLSF